MTIELRICPGCRKAFYAQPEGDLVKCPHCGFVLLDRRARERMRIKKDLDFVFSFKGKEHPAKLRDYSEGGLGIIYTGEPLSKDEVLDIDIEELSMHRPAEIVWSRRLPGEASVSGLRFISIIATLFVLIACAIFLGMSVVHAEPQANSAKAEQDYLIGPEDVLEISVWKNADLSKVVTVRPDGKISLPLVGDIKASGLTPTQLKDAIAARLKEYQETVVVSVIVQEVNSYKIYVHGEVAKPGVYVLKGRTSILQAVALAGGFTQFASKNKIVLIRQRDNGSVEKMNIRFEDLVYVDNVSILLKPGDTIFVP